MKKSSDHIYMLVGRLVMDEGFMSVPMLEKLVNISDLSWLQKEILDRYYGLNGKDYCTVREIAHQIGISESRVKVYLDEGVRRVSKALIAQFPNHWSTRYWTWEPKSVDGKGDDPM